MENAIIKLRKKSIEGMLKSPVKTASAVNLVYVNDTLPGIERLKRGKKVEYILKGSKIKDKQVLQRIKSLVIPPAWENVWICVLENGHLQATGIDIKKRKQYKYHKIWNAARNQTKFYRLHEFGKTLTKIRKHLQEDLSLPGLPLEKVLAAVVSLMEVTNIRVGNNAYEKLYGSFGITTLKDRHVSISKNQVRFIFKGKRGIQHDISIKNKRLATIVKKCRDIPGKELFQYYDDEGERRSIDSGMINEYIKRISEGEFSAKDFRTWSGTIHAYRAFSKLGLFETMAEGKKKVAEAFDIVSKQLGNTRTVCKKYYVHPIIISLYEKKELEKYLLNTYQPEDNNILSELSAEEKIVMEILESNSNKLYGIDTTSF